MNSESFSSHLEREKYISTIVHFIRILLAKELIDKDKLNDKTYVFETIDKNRNILGEMDVLWTMHDEFIQSAREAILTDRLEVAVVLIATAIEQIINTFYREVLEEDGRLTPNEITELIRTNNYNAKISWLLVLVADFDLNIVNDDLQKDIARLMELRNQVIHYKAVPVSKPNKHHIKQRIREFGIDRMLIIPNDLSETINDVALHNFRVENPDYLAIWKAVESFI